MEPVHKLVVTGERPFADPGPSVVDLHAHTTASDGTLTPTEVVTLAQKLGIRVLAVADHDSVGGVKEAMEAGAGLSVQVVPAVEMSLRNEPEKGFLELHLLGYYIDVDHPELQSVLAKSLEGQIDRIRSMVGKLRALGFDVSEQEVFDLAKEGVPHRTHIWLVVASHHGLTQPDRQPFFDEYLKPGGKAFTAGSEPSPKEAIQLVIRAGGVPILAHPGDKRPRTDPDAVIRQALSFGLRGIEVHYPYHKSRSLQGCSKQMLWETISHFDALADELGLLKTGGSDFHGKSKPIALGEMGMTVEAYLRFKQACGRG